MSESLTSSSPYIIVFLLVTLVLNVTLKFSDTNTVMCHHNGYLMLLNNLVTWPTVYRGPAFIIATIYHIIIQNDFMVE